jgi:MerR family transcriptional regulator, light-induced transcriptional regulator
MSSQEKHPDAPRAEAVAALQALLAEITGQVIAKFRIDGRFECGPFPCELAVMVDDLQERFGRTLVGVYELGMPGLVEAEFPGLVLPLMHRGAGSAFPAAMLDAWLVALRTTVDRRWQAELAAPVARLRQGLLQVQWASAPETAGAGPVAEFATLLLARQRRSAAEVALDHSRRAGAPERTFEELIGPALGRVGEMWERNRASVADEHAATEICRYITLRVLDAIPPVRPNGRRALVTCAPGEEHELGAEMLAGCLELRGWEVSFLGHSAPVSDVIASALEWRPQAALLSATMVSSLPGLHKLALELRRALPGVRVVAGGRAALLARGPLAGVVDGLAEDIASGCRLAESGPR